MSELTGAIPILRVNDLDASLEYYIKKLGLRRHVKKFLNIFIGLMIVIGGLVFWKNHTLQNAIAAANEEFETYVPPNLFLALSADCISLFLREG